jgi:uncharacterized membrane protein
MITGIEEPGSSETSRPGVGSSYKNGWNRLWKNFGILLVIGIIYFVISSIPSLIQWISVGFDPGMYMYGNMFSGPYWISMALTILVITPISLGVFYAYYKAASGEEPEFPDMFRGFRNYLNAVLAPIVVSVIVGIGFLLLIIPGIIFACKLVFVPLLVVDQKLNVIDAIMESWQMTDGHAFDVFLIGLLGIPIVIAGLICFGVGVIISYMWIYMATASLYHAIRLQPR